MKLADAPDYRNGTRLSSEGSHLGPGIGINSFVAEPLTHSLGPGPRLLRALSHVGSQLQRLVAEPLFPVRLRRLLKPGR